MCGIVGYTGKGSPELLQRMTDSLFHRGPDGSGTLIEAGLYLGHRRLSILDIEHGAQPMLTSDGNLVVVFNGEIYNHRELRKHLESRGYVFKTDHSDTEILLHGYCEWGKQLPAQLNGMFAFCVYDRVERRLFLGRDRLGEKPLFYFHTPTTFCFASEICALRLHPEFSGEIDTLGVQKFFAYGFTPGEQTMFAGAKQLSPGATLTYSIDSNEMKVEKYWDFRLEPDETLARRSEDELCDELLHLIAESARLRFLADVPVGVFLSGGIDSSAILAMLSTQQPAQKIQTFTIGFAEESFDESPYAAKVARQFSSEHRCETLSINVAKDIISELMAKLSEPIGDPSIVPTYLLSRHTRQHVKVALSGDGADELFAGYDPFAALSLASAYNAIVPKPVTKGLRSVIDQIPVSKNNMSFDFKLKRTLRGLGATQALWNPIWLGPLDAKELQELIYAPFDPEAVYEDSLRIWEETRGQSLVDRTLAFYTKLYLPNNILVKTDRASMLNSLETRNIYLDNHILEFCSRLPARYKLRRGTRKYLLKKALKRVLPAETLERKKKGFGIPLTDWLKTIPEPPPVKPLELINSGKAARLWEEHRRASRDNRQSLWCLWTLDALLSSSPRAF